MAVAIVVVGVSIGFSGKRKTERSGKKKSSKEGLEHG